MSANYVVYNPNNLPIDELPFIYGFNNGGYSGMYDAVLLAESGHCLGGHICSHEGYMRHDLGLIEGTRSDRHETFQKHYPNGYRMDFIGADSVKAHDGLRKAYAKNLELKKEHFANVDN